MDLILKYYPDLTDQQIGQFQMLGELYREWNAQINVISRKDTENFYERHVLHSLGLTEMMTFVPGTKILDVGTGGGFPGIPLAIFYPECQFHLVDSIGKKIKVVKEVANAIGLTNLTADHQRAEKVKDRYDFVVSRAVTRMNRFVPWVQNKISKQDRNAFPNGILYLKGGNLEEELSEIRQDYDVFELSSVYEEEFFETKKVVYVRLNLG